MSYRRGITYSVTAFHLDDPPVHEVVGRHEWMAIATAHVYNPNPDTGGALDPETAILAGAVMEVVAGTAKAGNEEQAVLVALKALLFQLNAKGFATTSTMK